MSKDEVLKNALSLSSDERAVLAAQLLESLSQPVDVEIEAAWAEEIDRRVAAYDRGEIDSIAAEEVMHRAQRRKTA